MKTTTKTATQTTLLAKKRKALATFRAGEIRYATARGKPGASTYPKRGKPNTGWPLTQIEIAVWIINDQAQDLEVANRAAE